MAEPDLSDLEDIALDQPQTEAPPEVELGPLSGLLTVATDPKRREAVIEGATDIAKKSALPMAGAVGGAVVGSALLPGGGTIAGEMIGAGFGEYLNQKLGITEPSNLQIAITAAAPGVARGIVAGGKTIFKFFPPGKGNQLLNELAPTQMAETLGKMRPTKNASQLFSEATRSGARLRLSHTVDMLDDVAKETSRLSGGAQRFQRGLTRYTTALQEKLQTNAGTLTPDELQAELNFLGRMIRSLERTGGPELGSFKQVFRAMQRDLDEAAKLAFPGAAPLKEARQLYRRGAALDKLEDVMEQATAYRGGKDFATFNAGQVINKLKRDDLFMNSFSKQEVTEIFDVLKLLTKIGSGHGMIGTRSEMIFGGVAGSAVGMATGKPVVGGLAGAAAGGVLPPIAESIRLFGLAMRTDVGRALIKDLLLGSQGQISMRVLGTMAVFAAAQTAEEFDVTKRPMFEHEFQDIFVNPIDPDAGESEFRRPRD